ncbi:hypothetical protein ANCDUO_05226 [Ancylostoma duodenale]|uniref:Uncharacterized protein n=1 Tax=Ancylostoma duodenale TaxID=51022 RepID=A0A0C2H515_9BILA|nr:hypothetical protein ANCDUO_05226 [Ancylostoma duodenale]
MTVGNGIRSSEGKKLLLDTTMGYKMDDLITSYISVLISGQTIRPSNTWKHESRPAEGIYCGDGAVLFAMCAICCAPKLLTGVELSEPKNL